MIRWLKWNLNCRRGRLCADLVVTVHEAPPDAIVTGVYTCGGCNTQYWVRREGEPKTRVRKDDPMAMPDARFQVFSGTMQGKETITISGTLEKEFDDPV